jgi:Arc/MetJ family transcription regulator
MNVPSYVVVIPTTGRPSLQACLDALADDRRHTPDPLPVVVPPTCGRAAPSRRSTILMMYSADVYHQFSLEGTVALTQIDIDEDALSEAMRLSGAKTKKDTVNLALREFAARHRRVAALEQYAALAAGWDFEGWQQRRAAEKDPAA